MDKGIYKKPTLYKRGPRAGRRRRVLLPFGGWYFHRRINFLLLLEAQGLEPPQEEKYSPPLWRLPVGDAKQGDATHSHWTH